MAIDPGNSNCGTALAQANTPFGRRMIDPWNLGGAPYAITGKASARATLPAYLWLPRGAIGRRRTNQNEPERARGGRGPAKGGSPQLANMDPLGRAGSPRAAPGQPRTVAEPVDFAGRVSLLSAWAFCVWLLA